MVQTRPGETPQPLTCFPSRLPIRAGSGRHCFAGEQKLNSDKMEMLLVDTRTEVGIDVTPF